MQLDRPVEEGNAYPCCKPFRRYVRRRLVKTCSTCKAEKPLNLFYVRRDKSAERPSSSCKTCVRQRTKARKESLSAAAGGKFYETPQPCRRGHVAPRIAATGDCSECYRLRDARRSAARNRTAARKEYFSAWCQANPDSVAAIRSRYATSERGRAVSRANFSRKYSTEPDFKARCALRNALKRVFRASGEKKRLKTQELLGYGPTELRSRISCQFKEGMDWSNYGEWEIDHKKPVARFIAQGVTDARVINALCNLQPLWQHENRTKSDKYAS